MTGLLDTTAHDHSVTACTIPAQDQVSKIRGDGRRPHEAPHSWEAICNWWLLRGGKSVFFRDVATEGCQCSSWWACIMHIQTALSLLSGFPKREHMKLEEKSGQEGRKNRSPGDRECQWSVHTISVNVYKHEYAVIDFSTRCYLVLVVYWPLWRWY